MQQHQPSLKINGGAPRYDWLCHQLDLWHTHLNKWGNQREWTNQVTSKGRDSEVTPDCRYQIVSAGGREKVDIEFSKKWAGLWSKFQWQ